MIKNILRSVTNDRKLKNMRKLCARWVPRVLPNQQKLKRADVSQYNFDMFKDNLKNFLRCFVTVDETWIHYYTPESNEELEHWIEVWWKSIEAVENATIGWQGYGNCFLRCAWYNSYCLRGERENNRCSILQRII